mgnify:CR=1 FL=1
MFEKAKDLFIKKWLTKKQKVFIEYMKQMWYLSMHQNWYEGAAHNTPSQNNALESQNLVIKKKKHSEKECHYLGFWNNVWTQCQNGQKNTQFKEKPTIELKN